MQLKPSKGAKTPKEQIEQLGRYFVMSRSAVQVRLLAPARVFARQNAVSVFGVRFAKGLVVLISRVRVPFGTLLVEFGFMAALVFMLPDLASVHIWIDKLYVTMIVT